MPSSASETEHIAPPEPTLLLAGKYEDLGVLGEGGMGEVRRVRDVELNRTLAMKIIHPHLMSHSGALSRFVDEGQVGAQLQHPNIVPVHEIGTLENGRLYITMQEIKGRELGSLIDEVHNASDAQHWGTSDLGWSLRKLIDIFHKVCMALKYAHSKGVVHRDLKPENILIGPFGEVLVVDWGIAKVVGKSEHIEDEIITNRNSQQRFQTQMGQVTGTPAYMAPEQARGAIDQIDQRTDVYALGAILYSILTGRPPYQGENAAQVIEQVLSGPPISVITQDNIDSEHIDGPVQTLSEITGPPLPEELVQACQRAMDREQAVRIQSAEELAALISDWLDGVQKRAQALKVVRKALDTDNHSAALECQITELRQRAKEGLKALPLWADESSKAAYWRMQDQATALATELETLAVNREQLLRAALTHKSDLEEAHLALAQQYRDEHERAEIIQSASWMHRTELKLREHAAALPERQPVRQDHFTYLRGLGALSITASEADAEFLLERYEPVHRRQVATFVRSLGVGPIVRCELEIGSYRLIIRKNGFHDTIYPFQINRGEHWDGIKPGETEPQPVQLLPLER